MVIAAPEGEADITCGGAPMVDAAAQPPEGLSISPDAAKGAALGKRYIDEEGSIELLCIKPGEGSIALGGVALGLKEAKPLPSSD
jgi:hypothetical protein